MFHPSTTIARFSAGIVRSHARQEFALGPWILSVAALAFGPGCEGRAASAPAHYPAVAEVSAQEPAFEYEGVSVSGGYGSALATSPAQPGLFYLLCDRGPNVDTKDDHVIFLDPTFTPRIGCFRLAGESLEQVKVIELADEHGRKLTGLPREQGPGGTGEVPEDRTGRVLDRDTPGVDTEGLVAMPDGSFWVSEEYGPSLLHVDATGRTTEWIDAGGPKGRSLPKVLQRRWPNRGMEGLCITPDGRTLVGAMESPLDNPSKEVRKESRVVRLLFFDVASGKTRQSVYLLDEPKIGISDIVALSDTTFLVIERDKKFPGDADEPSRVKRVYRIGTREASDVSDPSDSDSGLLVDGKTLEQLSEEELRAAAIQPITKTLVVDLLALPGGYAHDKPEGLALIGDRWLAISNDNDFGIDDDGEGHIVPKKLPAAANAVDRSQVRFVLLEQPM